MKILFCLNHFLPDQIAGTEVYVFSLIKALEKKNVQAKVLIPNYGKRNTKEYEIEKIKVIKYAEPSVLDRRAKRGYINSEGLKEFIRIVQYENPDIVHFHELSDTTHGITLYHIKSVKNLGFKVVMTFHLAGYSCKTGNLMYKERELCDGIIRIKRCSACSYYSIGNSELFSKLLTPISMLLYKIGLNTTLLNKKAGTAFGFPFVIKRFRNHFMELADNCHKLVALTHWYKNILIKNGIPENKISTITQGLPYYQNEPILQQPVFAKKVNEPGKNKMLRLIFIGRISYIKGVHLLIEAMQNLPPENVSLDIYGQVNESAYAANCVQRSKGLTNIHWKGILAPAQVINTLSKYDALCLPSAFSEMSPLVIQEAFAAGIPVVASDVYGNAEQIKDGKNGWLFKFKDSEDLRNKLNELIESSGQMINAKKYMPAIKSFEEVAEEYRILYCKIIEIN
ncbi:MAG: glycosyltransferase [Ginsengibacter sp.]